MKSEYFIIAFILFVIISGVIKKVNCFNSFSAGVKEGTLTVLNMFTYIIGFVFMLALIESCGILKDIGGLYNTRAFSPMLLVQTIIRPFSGTASLAIMTDIYEALGPDSASGILSSFIHTISDSAIYIICFYFGAVGIKKYGRALGIGLIINVLAFLMAVILTFTFFKV